MLQIKDLTFDVTEEKGQKEIIKGLNLNVDEGKFIVITGPNGSGKSTLAKLIAGIEHPTSGRIFFDGADITELSITERANLGISFAFQQPVRFKGITVLDLLRLAAKKRLSVGEACNYLSEVGLCAKDYVNREVNASLSGGELKRIEIATVLARGTRLSIFDEPEAGIDLWSFQSLIKVFRHMRDTIHGSIIIIPTRSGFWTLPMRSWCSPAAASVPRAPKRRSCRSCCAAPTWPAAAPKSKREGCNHGT